MGGRAQSTSIDVSPPPGVGYEEGGRVAHSSIAPTYRGGERCAPLVSFMFIHFVS